MKKLYIIANWKSYKTRNEIELWFHEVARNTSLPYKEEKEVIICPSFPYLSFVKDQIAQLQLPFSVGAQTISSFEEGKFTGEVNAKQVKEFANYVLLGHSERKKYCAETDLALEAKVAQAESNSLTSIYCVEDSGVQIPNAVSFVAYEPPTAISPGIPDTPENASLVAETIKQSRPDIAVLYGGSVTVENVHTFTSLSTIDGVLVGKASLDPIEFTTLLTNA